MRASWQNVPFRRLWLSNLTSGCAAQIIRIAVILFLFHQENDIRRIALFVIAATVPAVVMAPLAGALIDRSNKRTVLLIAEGVRMAAAASILVRPEATVIYAATVVDSIASAFFEPVRAACVPVLVEPATRPSANGLDQMSSGLVLIVGPIAGADIFLGGGIVAAVIVALMLRAVSLLLLASLPALSLSRVSGAGNTIGAIREGWTFIGTHGTSLVAVLLVAVSIFCVTLWVPIAPFHLKQLFADSGRILGLQTGLFGVGAMIGGLAAPRVLPRFGCGAVFFSGLALEAIVLAVYSQIHNVLASIAVCLFWGVCVSLTLAAYTLLIQEFVGTELLGRVFAFAQQGEGIATMASMALAAALFRLMSAQQILLLAGIVYLLIVSFSAATPIGGRLLRTRGVR